MRLIFEQPLYEKIIKNIDDSRKYGRIVKEVELNKKELEQLKKELGIKLHEASGIVLQNTFYGIPITLVENSTD